MSYADDCLVTLEKFSKPDRAPLMAEGGELLLPTDEDASTGNRVVTIRAKDIILRGTRNLDV